jgi:membrane fusion protein (multidrug efflux system)
VGNGYANHGFLSRSIYIGSQESQARMSEDLKAPSRSSRPRKVVATPAPQRVASVRPNNGSMLGKIALMAVFIAIGAGAMYIAMPALMAGKAGGPPAGMPAGAGGPPVGKGAPGAGGPPGMAAMAMPVEGLKVSKTKMAKTLTATATLRANESATIKPEIAGRVTKIAFTEGGTVKKGDVLFEMDDSVQRAALAQANANVSATRNNMNRYKELEETRAVARAEVETAQAAYNAAAANVSLAKANLAKMTIRAPFDGQAGIRSVSVGDVVDPSRDLVTISQTTPLRVLFDLPERYLPLVQAGQTVNFSVESHPDVNFEASVNAIDSTIDPVTRAVRVQATTPNENNLLLSGQFATLNFAMSAATDVLAVPDSALVPEGGQISVYTVGEDGMLAKTSVQAGIRDGVNVEITSGLKEGDTVVTAGQQKIFPGMKVMVKPPSKVNVTPPPEEKTEDALQPTAVQEEAQPTS